ncbi:MAG: SCP2 sterol-binding domain-containing protein [Proteobacteria bacterium]|nr:SCP2 sterol-binding domain-containing protein [Pseudomonadota bacterium]
MNQFLGSIVLFPIEQILNQLLKNDAHLAKRLSPFAGKVIQVKSSMPTISLTLSFDAGRIRLSAIDSETLMLNPDAIISGRSSDLLDLIIIKSDRRPLANKAISISGDVLLVQDIYHTLMDLDIDWEDYLAPLLGDVITNEIGQFADDVRQWSDGAKRSMQRNVDDYLKEEIRVVPGRAEVDSFGDDLDRLKLDIDRLQARTDNLCKRLDQVQ